MSRTRGQSSARRASITKDGPVDMTCDLRRLEDSAPAPGAGARSVHRRINHRGTEDTEDHRENKSVCSSLWSSVSSVPLWLLFSHTAPGRYPDGMYAVVRCPRCDG